MAARGRFPTYKVVLLGELGVGKTSLFRRLKDNTFDKSQPATAGIDSCTKAMEVDGETIMLSIWDTAGVERYRELTRNYYRNASATVFVYSVSEASSLHYLTQWIKDAQNFVPNAVRMLVGNKVDLEAEIDPTTIKCFASAHELELQFLISCKTNSGIAEVFEQLARALHKSPPSSGHGSGAVGDKKPALKKDGVIGREELEDKPQQQQSKLAEIDYSDLQFLDPLGEGGFGMVYKGMWNSRNIFVAIKKQNIINEREREILGSLCHPNFIQLHGVVMQTPYCFLVTELAENGSIYDYLHQKKENPSLEQSLLWAKQIAEGMNYLHQKDIIHRDLKSTNIVLSSDFTAKICDLGSARILEHTTHQTTAVGTYAWMSPEMFRREEVSKECDVYSYSILLWEIITCKVPFSDEGPFMIPALVIAGKRPPLPDCDVYLQLLMQQCWNDKPKERPRFDSILLILHNKEFKEPLKQEKPSAEEKPSIEKSSVERKSGKKSCQLQ